MVIFGGIFDYDGKKERLEEVIGLSEDPDLWNDPKKAEAIGKERKMLEDVVLTVEEGFADLRPFLPAPGWKAPAGPRYWNCVFCSFRRISDWS